jgi:hypothetical protein
MSFALSSLHRAATMHAARLSLSLILMTTSFALTQEEPSRLRYVIPEGWTPGIDGRTLLPPGGNSVVTFGPSTTFARPAEQWMLECWNIVSRGLKLVSGPAPGTQGEFLTRIGVFQQPDGTHVWLCLGTLIKNDRGESVIYLARDEAQFRADVPSFARMLQGITIAAPTVGLRSSTPDATSTPPGVPAAAAAEQRGPVVAGNDDVAGLHLATTRQLRFNPLGGSGGADWEMRTEYYLFSRDGRVFRGRDLPSAPEGDIGRFDFEAARRQAPGNYGTYTVRAGQVVMQFPDETVTATRPGTDVLAIRGTKFQRSIRAKSASPQPAGSIAPAPANSPGTKNPR